MTEKPSKERGVRDMKTAQVWVELVDTIKRIDEAIDKDLEDIPCQNPACDRINSIEFDLILRDTTKIDNLTGLAPKVRNPTRMCRPCMKELREELAVLRDDTERD